MEFLYIYNENLEEFLIRKDIFRGKLYNEKVVWQKKMLNNINSCFNDRESNK